MENRYSLSIASTSESSALRKEFEHLEGKFGLRDISIHNVTDRIKNLEKRPEYTPKITISQVKKPNEQFFYGYAEVIYTSNEFLVEFEKFLRSYQIPVEAEKFEDVPDEYRNFFQMPFTEIPVNVQRTELNIKYPNEEPRNLIRFDKFAGVDFSSHCTLKMLPPEELYKKLDKIENASDFSAHIERISSKNINNWELLFSESKNLGRHLIIKKI